MEDVGSVLIDLLCQALMKGFFTRSQQLSTRLQGLSEPEELIFGQDKVENTNGAFKQFKVCSIAFEIQ